MRILVWFLVCMPIVVFAQDLGVWGQVYPIQEQPMNQLIRDRLAQKERSGALAKINEQTQKRVIAHAQRPAAVHGLTTTTNPKIWLFDPSITLRHDIHNVNGVLIAKSGTRVNPLETVSMSKTLVFFDADDPRQLAWIKKEFRQFKKPKLILVGGDIKSTQEALDMRVYFDQDGRLTQHFKLHHVPIVIRTASNKTNLEIMEIGRDSLPAGPQKEVDHD